MAFAEELLFALALEILMLLTTDGELLSLLSFPLMKLLTFTFIGFNLSDSPLYAVLVVLCV